MSATTERERTSQEAPKQPGLRPMLFKMLANPGALKKMWTMDPDEPRYVRPSREYDLPEYRQGMPRCTSNAKYLRPTRWCNPREPLVIAMANELGAYELSDWEFAEAAFWFVKTTFLVEFLPLNTVSDSLRRGTGTCYHSNSVWLALCRAAGIKARYKSFNMVPHDEIMSMGAAFGETGETMTNMLSNGLPEIEGEVCIDGKWVVGHVAMRPEICAYVNLPIPRFGEDAIGLTLLLAPGGRIKRFESIPLATGIQTKVVMPLLKATMERASLITRDTVPQGRNIIEEAGGLEAYDRKARRRMRLFSEDEITGRIKEASAHKSWSLEGDK